MSFAVPMLAALVGLLSPGADQAHDEREAVKHYRAGKEALAQEKYADAEQEFRLAA